MGVLIVIIIIDILVIAGMMYMVSSEKVSNKREPHPFVVQDALVSSNTEHTTDQGGQARDWAIETLDDSESLADAAAAAVSGEVADATEADSSESTSEA